MDERYQETPDAAPDSGLDQRLEALEKTVRRLADANMSRQLLDPHVPAGEQVAVVADPVVLPFEALGRPVIGLVPETAGSAAAVARLEALRVQGVRFVLVSRSRSVGKWSRTRCWPSISARTSGRLPPSRRSAWSSRRRVHSADRRGAAGARGADRRPRLGRPLGADARLDLAWDWRAFCCPVGLSSGRSSPMPKQLPYLDHTIDVVLVDDAERMDEAARVGANAVVRVTADGDGRGDRRRDAPPAFRREAGAAPVLILVATDADDEWLGRLTEAVAERPGVEVRAAVDPLAAPSRPTRRSSCWPSAVSCRSPVASRPPSASWRTTSRLGGVAVKLFDADGSLEARRRGCLRRRLGRGDREGCSGSRAVARVRAPRRRRGRARRAAIGCGAADARRPATRARSTWPRSRLSLWSSGWELRYQPDAAAVRVLARRQPGRASGRRRRTDCRHGPPSSTTAPGAACWRATKWELSDDPATCPRVPDALPRDRSRHRLSARGHVHTLAARARLVGDLPGDRERQRATARASPAAARDPDLRRLSTRRRESSPPASSISPCSRSGSPLRGCFRSCARSRPKPAS